LIFSNSHFFNKSFISTSDCFNILHEPIVKCHTSEFHICHSGSQICFSEASNAACLDKNNLSKVGVTAFLIALFSIFSFNQNQSNIMSHIFFIELKNSYKI
jgi:hypothetical protein